MKLCVDCKHFNRGSFACEHPHNMIVSLVSGLLRPRNSADYMRSRGDDSGICGLQANWFEERKEQAA